jgi:hypothetical protein
VRSVAAPVPRERSVAARVITVPGTHSSQNLRGVKCDQKSKENKVQREVKCVLMNLLYQIQFETSTF